jgi:hypothetical protein
VASTGKPRRDLDTAAYRAARTEFLQHHDVCHWCRRAKATTVDHIIEVDRGIDPMDITNWAPACHKCNSRRGAEHLAKKRANQVAKRKNQKKSEVFFENEKMLPPTPSGDVSQNVGMMAEEGGLVLTPSDGAVFGRIPPRLITRGQGSGSYAAEVAEVAKAVLEIELMPWQIEALAGQLSHDDAGGLCYRRSLVSVARQNGKSVALRALIAWALTREPIRRGEPVLLISTAHSLDLAVEQFEALAPILEAKFGAKPYWSYGRNELEMPDGSRWLVQAATPKAFHGYSPHYIVADEVWNVSSDVLFNGAIPSQRARREPMLSMWSTAGTEDSKAMIKFREEGLRAIDEDKPGKLFFAEWSIPPGVETDDAAFWHMANPALGHTLEFDTLIDESGMADKSAFLRASLNLWISSAQSWVQPGEFNKLQIDQVPAGGVLAVDSSIDESNYAAVRAVKLDDGRIGVTVAFVAQTLAEVWTEIEKLAPDLTTIALTPSLATLAPAALERKKVIVGYSELLTHTATVRQFITERLLVHTGEQMLLEHVNRAVGVKTQGGFVLSSQKSPGLITLARCMVWAAALVARPQQKTRAAVAFSR